MNETLKVVNRIAKLLEPLSLEDRQAALGMCFTLHQSIVLQRQALNEVVAGAAERLAQQPQAGAVQGNSGRGH